MLSFQHTLTTYLCLLDFHNLVLAVLKTVFSKKKPREKEYINYKCFNSENFNDELEFFHMKTLNLAVKSIKRF